MATFLLLKAKTNEEPKKRAVNVIMLKAKRANVGETRNRKGGRYIKIGPGKWKRVKESGARGPAGGPKEPGRGWGLGTPRSKEGAPAGKPLSPRQEKIAKRIKELGQGLSEREQFEADDIQLAIARDGELYRQMLQPIQANLIKKIEKGTYSHDGALVAFTHVVKKGADNYDKDFSNKTLNNVRAAVVLQMAKDFYEENKTKGEKDFALDYYVRQQSQRSPGVDSVR